MNFSFSASYIAVWALVLFQGLLIVALLRQLAELRRLIESGNFQAQDHLPVGSPAPNFSGVDVRTGQSVSSNSLTGSGGVIIFLSPECALCKSLAASLVRGIGDLPQIIAFCKGGQKGCAYFVKRLGPEIQLLAEGAEGTASRYHVSSFPTAVAVDGNQKIRGYAHPSSLEDVKQLVARNADVVDDREQQPDLSVYSSSAYQ